MFHKTTPQFKVKSSKLFTIMIAKEKLSFKPFLSTYFLFYSSSSIIPYITKTEMHSFLQSFEI